MACTAAITLSTAATDMPRTINAICTITNLAASAVRVTWIQPYVVVTGTTPTSTSTASGFPNIGPGMNVTVPASGGGTLALSYPVSFFAPIPSGFTFAAQVTTPPSVIYDVGAICYFSDGTSCVATVANFTGTAMH